MNTHITPYVDIQHACQQNIPVSDEVLADWISLILPVHQTHAELTLRLVEKDEIKMLNHTYRKQNKTTNVLAFPSDLPQEIMLQHFFLGDVIICPAVLEEESLSFEKSLIPHWAHIVIHGVLHLLGYDHQNDQDTLLMQSLEIQALTKLGFNNPYALEDLLIE